LWSWCSVVTGYKVRPVKKMPHSPPRIAVLGSINLDLVIRCVSIPRPGETLLAEAAAEVCGGKGANQAVAAARAGGSVTMIGRVGDDAFAGRLVANLERENIDCQWVRTTSRCASGLAIVSVAQTGENAITVVSGANARLSAADVAAARNVITAADVLLVQWEVPLDTVLAAMDIAHAAGVQIILDPAPTPKQRPAALFDAALFDVDLICPNESEAAALTGSAVETREQIEAAAAALHHKGARQVAITVGRRGALLWAGEKSAWVEPFSVTAVDTTAAGDAFAGALAVFWAEQDDLLEAVRFANAAGALAASRRGAQPSLGARGEIETLWRTKK